MMAVEEINKKLFEMQGASFSKEPGAGFLPIQYLQAGRDFPVNSASSTECLPLGHWYHTL